MGYYTSYSLKVDVPQYESNRPEKCLKCNHKAGLKDKFCSNCGTLIEVPVINAEYIIADLRSSNGEADYALDKDGTPNDSSKWYEHDPEMKAFSKKYPEAVFTLRGEGEEAGDVWLTYYKNGKSHTQEIEIKFDPFDPKKLT